jgi:hypothetical protein
MEKAAIENGMKEMQKNRKLDLWLGRRVSSLGAWLIALTIIILSTRGFIVLNLPLSANTVYITTSITALILAAYGFIISKEYKNDGLILLRNLLIINGFLTVINVAIDFLLGVPFDASTLYYSLGPYIVFLLLRVPTFYLKVVIGVIAIAISYSVCDNFFDTLQGEAGIQKVFEYSLKLRPEVFEALSRTGEFFRVGGYTGSYHDSANILGMAGVFFFVRYVLKRKLFDLILSGGVLFSMLLTQSAANIVIAIFTIFLFGGYILLRSRGLKIYLYLLFAFASVIVLDELFPTIMTTFVSRVGGEGDWEGMTNQLDANSLLSSIPFVLVGHGAGFGSENIKTEIGLLKGLLQWGIIHAVVVYWILLYPVFRYVKIRSICFDALPSVSAISFGFMSLLHYGSLFRVTNIFLFFSFYAISLNTIIYCRNSMYQAHSGREPDEKIV